MMPINPSGYNKDYYAVLGIPENASDEEVKKAYRRLAKKHHPDGSDEPDSEKFRIVSEAYEVLGNSRNRRQYDRMRILPNMFGATAHASIFNSPIFSTPDIVPPVEVVLPLTVEQIANGHQIDIGVWRESKCDTCDGRGYESIDDVQQCTACHGTGRLARGLGMLFGSITCMNCGGRGKILLKPCRGCGGSGKAKEEFRVRVDFRRGSKIGSVRSVKGEGNWSPRSNCRGDIYVRLACKPHKFYAVDGTNLRCVVPVTLAQALFGGQVAVPTPYGNAMLTVPEGTQSGRVLRMRGKGLPDGDSAGDLLVSIMVEIPSVPPESRKTIQDAFEHPLEYTVVSDYEAYLQELSEAGKQD